MRADFVDRGFDLFFYDLGDYYQVLVGTALGDDMVLAAGPLFQPVTQSDIDASRLDNQMAEVLEKRTIDTQLADRKRKLGLAG